MTNVAAELLSTFETRLADIAIVNADGTTVTYGQLVAEIDRVRNLLGAASLAPASKVIVQVPKGLAFASATIALAAEGHAAVGIEMAQGDDVYRDRSRYVDADAVITTRKVRAIQASAFLRNQLAKRSIDVPPPLDVQNIDWDGTSSLAPAATQGRPVQAVRDEDTVLVVFTGGTSDRPKGVQLSHRAVRHYLAGLAGLPEWPTVTTMVADHPQQVLYGLAHGKTVHLSPARTTRRARRIAELLFEQGVDCYFGSPAAWTDILEVGVHRRATTSPHAVLLGGAPVTQTMLELLERELDPSVAIRCLYGMSEAGLVAHISAADKLALLRSGDCDGDPVGTIAAGVTVTTSSDGELLVASPARFSGYIGAPHAAADEAFATGDVGRLDGDTLLLLGRKKNMIVHRGVNLYPEQFEGRLMQQRLAGTPAFADVALIAGPANSLGDEHFVLYYVSDSTTPSAATALCRKVMPAGHGPTNSVRLPALPRTGRQNKIDRRALAAQVPDRSLLAIHGEFFDRAFHLLPARSAERRRAMVLRAITRKNLIRCQQLEPSKSMQIEPIIILGHQRSGTTLLHHGLASSPSAVALTLPDMLAPHPLGWRASTALGPLVRLAFSAAHRSSRWRSVFERHELDPSAPEEEEWLFAALGLSGFLPSGFAATLGSAAFDDLRDRSSWPAETRSALVELYATILSAFHTRRATLSPVRHVAKNPAFAAMAVDLLEAFPAARFVVALRDPHDAICSRVALVSAIHGRTLTTAEVSVIVADSTRQMRALSRQISSLPPDRVHAVAFSELMNDPRGVVDRACRFAGLVPPTALPVMRCSPLTHPPAGVPAAHEIEAEITEFVELCSRWDLAS